MVSSMRGRQHMSLCRHERRRLPGNSQQRGMAAIGEAERPAQVLLAREVTQGPVPRYRRRRRQRTRRQRRKQGRSSDSSAQSPSSESSVSSPVPRISPPSVAAPRGTPSACSPSAVLTAPGSARRRSRTPRAGSACSERRGAGGPDRNTGLHGRRQRTRSRTRW